jgi:IS1 family transposase
MNTLPLDKKLTVISSLLEGNSVRSTERMTGVHRDTICRLLVQAGQRSAAVMDGSMRGLHCGFVQCDEIWCYVGKKDRRIAKDERSPEIGSQWVFIAMDEDTKLVPCYLIGKRSRETTIEFLWELKKRLNAERFQITTDGYHFYRSIQGIFAGQADFAQLIKMFGDYGQHDTPEARYSPPGISEVISKIVDGRPDETRICTSHVERQNLTMRMQMRRFTRLTNAFSKKLANLKAACALHFAHYNFCRVHTTLRVTPAMAAGVCNEIWPLESLLG